MASWGGRDPDAPPPAAELASFGLVKEKYTLVERMVEAAQRARRLSRTSGWERWSPWSWAARPPWGRSSPAWPWACPPSTVTTSAAPFPEAGQSKMDLAGIPPTPMAMVDRWGNVTLVKSAVRALMADRLAPDDQRGRLRQGRRRAPSYLAQMRDSKRGFVRGSLLTSIEVGARCAREGAPKEPLAPARQGHGRQRPLHRRGGGHRLGERRGVHVPQVHLPDQGHRGRRRIRPAASG